MHKRGEGECRRTESVLIQLTISMGSIQKILPVDVIVVAVVGKLKLESEGSTVSSLCLAKTTAISAYTLKSSLLSQ